MTDEERIELAATAIVYGTHGLEQTLACRHLWDDLAARDPFRSASIRAAARELLEGAGSVAKANATTRDRPRTHTSMDWLINAD